MLRRAHARHYEFKDINICKICMEIHINMLNYLFLQGIAGLVVLTMAAQIAGNWY